MTDCAIIGIPSTGTFAGAVYKDCTPTYTCLTPHISRNNHFDKMTLVTMWVPMLTQSVIGSVFISRWMGRVCGVPRIRLNPQSLKRFYPRRDWICRKSLTTGRIIENNIENQRNAHNSRWRVLLFEIFSMFLWDYH